MSKRRSLQPALPPPWVDRREGIVALGLDIRVSASEMASWRPELISRFFGGIAMVRAARDQALRELEPDIHRDTHGPGGESREE